MKNAYSSQQKKVSILLSCYNATSLIKDYIDFLLKPEIVEHCTLIAVNFPFSHSDPEIVVKNLERYPDIILINSDNNVSLYDAWNVAIKSATTEFVSNLNLDDRVSSDYYSFGVTQLQKMNADIFSSFSIRTSVIGVESDDAQKQTHLDYQRFVNNNTIRYYINDLISINKDRIIKKSIPHCAPIWKRSLHDELGYFNSKRFDFCADFEFWLRAIAVKKAFVVSREYKTLFYCATGTASDRLMHPENSKILERWRHTFPPIGYRETHLGKKHDFLHHCMNMNTIFSSASFYQHLMGNSVFKEIYERIHSLGLIPETQSLKTDTDSMFLKRKTKCRLLPFKNINKGKRCILMCNGPSLKDVNFSRINRSQYMFFGLNKIYMGFELFGFYPDYIVAVNKKVIEQAANVYKSLPVTKFLSNRVEKEIVHEGPNTFYINTVNLPDEAKRFSTDICSYVTEGWTVTHAALQIIHYMGFTEVYIVGMDHRFSQFIEGQENKEDIIKGADVDHFHPNYFGYGQAWDHPDLINSEISYRAALDVYRNNGRMIFDCTINGACKVFPKLPVDILYQTPTDKFSGNNSITYTPIISVIIPVSNSSAYLYEVIKSVYEQNIGDLEIIMVDDNSSDESWYMMKLLASKDKRIQIIKNSQKKGLPGTLNTGIYLSKGDYIAFLSPDAVFSDNALHLRLEKIKNLPAGSIVHSITKVISNTGTSVGIKIGEQKSISFKDILKNPLSLNSMLFPAALLKKHKINEKLSALYSWHLLAQLLRNGSVSYFVPDAGALYKIEPFYDTMIDKYSYRAQLKKVLKWIHSPIHGTDFVNDYSTGLRNNDEKTILNDHLQKYEELKNLIQSVVNNRLLPDVKYCFDKIILSGEVDKHINTYTLKPPYQNNWIACIFDKTITTGDEVRADIIFKINKNCSLIMMLCRDGTTTFESAAKKMTLFAGQHSLNLTYKFQNSHNAFRLQIGVENKQVDVSDIKVCVIKTNSLLKPDEFNNNESWIGGFMQLCKKTLNQIYTSLIGFWKNNFA